jgi:hypothetical protein
VVHIRIKPNRKKQFFLNKIFMIKEVLQMKSQKKHKKLSFSKRTIADLNFKGLNGVHGGEPVMPTSIPFCETYCDEVTCANTCYYSCDDITCPHVGTMCPVNLA